MKTKLKLNNKFAIVGTLLLLFVYPLFMTDKYFNITISKFEFFALVSAVFAMFTFLAESDNKAKKKNDSKLTFKQKITQKLDVTDISYLVLLLFGAITVLVSGYGKSAFFGNNGRYMGYDFFLAAGLAYLFISRHNILKEYELIAFEISASLACLLGVFQACGVDLFNLISPISAHQKSIFISTFGNIDIFSAFLSISVPISMYMICFRERNGKHFILYFVTAAFGFFGLFLSNSDSGYLGVFAAFWVICLLSFKDKKYLQRFSDLCLFFFVLAFVYGLLKKVGIIKRHLSFFSELLTSSKLVYIFMAIFFVLSLALRIIKLNEKGLKVLKIIYIAASVFLIVALIFAIAYFTYFNTDFDLGSFNSYFRFNDYWGTNRGFVWRIYLELYNEFPLTQKLFGCGQDCLSLKLTDSLYREMVEFGNYTNNAHNEYIQYLVTIGIFGLAAYMTFVISALIKLFKDKENSLFSYAIAVSIIAYLAQAIVNITQPIVTPLLFLFVAFASCKKELNNVNK